MDPTPPPAEAVVAVLRRDDRFLIIRRGPGVVLPGYWTPPSGRVEPGETYEQALEREIGEELGVSATATEEVWQCPTDDGDFVLHWWTADLGGAEDDMRLDPHEVAEARWVTSEEFLELDPTFEGDREFFLRVAPKLIAP